MDRRLDCRPVADLVYFTKPDVFLDRRAEFGETLEDCAEMAVVLGWVIQSDVDAVDEETPSVIINDSEEYFGKGGFPWGEDLYIIKEAAARCGTYPIRCSRRWQASLRLRE